MLASRLTDDVIDSLCTFVLVTGYFNSLESVDRGGVQSRDIHF